MAAPRPPQATEFRMTPTNRFRSVFAHSLLGVLLALGACSGAPPPAGAPAPTPDNPSWATFVNEFIEGTFRAQPMSAVQQGRHEFDGQMPDFSAAGIAAEIDRLKTARAAAQAVTAESLSDTQRFEREYLISELNSELFWLDKAAWWSRSPSWTLGQLDPEVYLSREYAPLPQRLKGYLGYARAIPGIAAELRRNLRTPMPRTFVEHAVKATAGYADFYQHDVPKVFASVADPAAQKELAAANAAAIRAMRELRDWFVSLRRTANDDYALGPELYAQMLHDTDAVDMPVAQIKAAGEADVARNTAMLKEACAAFAPGASIPDCVAKSNADKPPKGPVEGARERLGSLREFVRTQDLVTIPSEEQAAVAEAPPYNRSNSAYIVIPGPYEKNVASVYTISPPDPAWSRKEQHDYIDGEAKLTNTTIHEVWPGHFLQFLHANRSASMIGRLFVGYDFAEGWAHYAEEMMWEAGFGDGRPDAHIAQLKDALWRDARLLSSIGLHTEGMTVAQSEKLFRDIAYDDAGNARQQAARGTMDPAYLNYTLGKLEIRKLREDWIARQLAGKSGAQPRGEWKAFHDRFLSHGGPPIPLVRRAMLPGDTGPVL
jgi:hypothetical protein